METQQVALYCIQPKQFIVLDYGLNYFLMVVSMSRFYGSRTPMTDSRVNRKRIRTNRQRYGGNAPAGDPRIAAKIHKKKELSDSLLGEQA